MFKTYNHWRVRYVNDLAAFNPEIWAMESLMVLYEKTVAAQLVHREFDSQIAQFGDVVNTRRPGKFVAKRKGLNDDVVSEDATATNVPVSLNQHWYHSFVIKDGEESRSMQSLIDTYMRPSVESIAKAIDEAVIGMKYRFVRNVVGNLGSNPDIADLVDLQTKLNDQLCPEDDRRFIMSPKMHGTFLKIDTFHEADKAADLGDALRRALIGQAFGLDFYMSQNNKVITASDVTTTLVNDSTDLGIGATTVEVDSASGITAGCWITIAGDMTPQLVTNVAGTTLTFAPGLKNAVLNNATVTSYDKALVNFSDGYALGYAKEIAVDDLTKAIRTGQMVTDGTSFTGLDTYSAMSLAGGDSTTTFLPNVPLTEALANNDPLGLGPAGDYGWAFHKNAVGLITRPLSPPVDGTGARSAIMDYNGLGLRVVITYDGVAQGHRVTIDLLGGLALFDENLGALLLG